MTAAGYLAVSLMREATMHANERHRKAPEELSVATPDTGSSSTAWKKQRTLPETMERKPTEADKPPDDVADEEDEDADSKSSVSDCNGDHDVGMCSYHECGEQTEKCECGNGDRQHCSEHAISCKDRVCVDCAKHTVNCTQCGVETHENDPEGIPTSSVSIKVPKELREKFPGFPETFNVILCENCVPFGPQ